MKKHLLLLVACLFSAVFAMAQKETVEIYRVLYNPNSLTDELAGLLRDNLMNKLVATGRLNLVEVAVSEPRTASETDNRFGLTIKAEAITTKSEYYQSTNRYKYTAYLQYLIILYDLQNGTIISREEYNEVGTSYENSYRASMDAVTTAGNGIKSFVEKAFPVRGEILAVADGNDKKAKSVYINLGTEAGMDKGQKFAVYTLVDIAGEISEQEIGKLTITKVMSASRSECKVDKGGEAINTALKNGDQLIIKTIQSGMDKFDEWLSR